MQTCLICKAPINHLHSNSRYCEKHKKHKFNPVPKVEMVSIPYEELQKLIRDSKDLKQIKELLCYQDKRINHK